MRRWTTILLLLLVGGLVWPAWADPPAESAALTVGGARLGPVPELLYAHLPALPPGQGVVVETLAKDSLLARAGLRPNDVLLTCDGVRLRDGKQFADLLAEAKPGESHRLVMLRGGQGLSLAFVPTLDPPPVPKSVLKPGGPPAVTVEAQPLERGKLRISFVYYSPAGKLERVTCSGSLNQIENEVRQLGEQQRMPARVQDLADVALKRLRVLNQEQR